MDIGRFHGRFTGGPLDRAASAENGASGSAPARLPSLTGLRWLAAFGVFAFHIGTLHVLTKPYYEAKWNTYFGQGASGVSFFFVLSGFVLTWTALAAGGGDTAVRFWRRRIAKIFPNHAVTWFAVILLMLAWGDELRPEVAVGNLFLLQSWLNFDTFPYSINTVSWTLSCEAFFYLCFPLVLPFLRRANTYVLYALATLLVGVIYQMTTWTAGLDFPQRWWLTQMFPPTRSLEFWLGCVAALLVSRGRWYGPNLTLATIFAVYILAMNRDWDTKYWTSDVALAYVLLIAAAAKADVAGRWTPWRNRVLVWLGEVSFAFYLVHVAFMTNFLRLLERHGPRAQGDAGVDFALTAGLFAGSLLLAWLLFRFVEKPMNRRLRPKPRDLEASRAGQPRSSNRLAVSTVVTFARTMRGRVSSRRRSKEVPTDQAVGA